MDAFENIDFVARIVRNREKISVTNRFLSRSLLTFRVRRSGKSTWRTKIGARFDKAAKTGGERQTADDENKRIQQYLAALGGWRWRCWKHSSQSSVHTQTFVSCDLSSCGASLPTVRFVRENGHVCRRTRQTANGTQCANRLWYIASFARTAQIRATARRSIAADDGSSHQNNRQIFINSAQIQNCQRERRRHSASRPIRRRTSQPGRGVLLW